MGGLRGEYGGGQRADQDHAEKEPGGAVGDVRSDGGRANRPPESHSLAAQNDQILGDERRDPAGGQQSRHP